MFEDFSLGVLEMCVFFQTWLEFLHIFFLVGGFNPFEKYEWESSPKFGMKIKNI